MSKFSDLFKQKVPLKTPKLKIPNTEIKVSVGGVVNNTQDETKIEDITFIIENKEGAAISLGTLKTPVNESKIVGISLKIPI